MSGIAIYCRWVAESELGGLCAHHTLPNNTRSHIHHSGATFKNMSLVLFYVVAFSFPFLVSLKP